MQIQFEEPTAIEFIGYNEICRNARFVFDKPFRVDLEDILELENGMWFLISKGVRVPMFGRWCR